MGIQERKERERERRRQQIMVAARRVFSAKGLEKSTMEDIAKEAELSPGTLYLYFRNKDELFASLSLRMLQFLNIRLEELEQKRTLSVEKKFHVLKKALYDVYDFDPLVLINMFHLQSSETLKNLSDELIQEIKTLSRKSLRSMAHVFEEGIKEKRFIERHPTAMADSLWALFSGIVLWEESKKIIDDNKNYLKPTLDLAFEIFWRGVCA
ncbi:MAG: helix-turn-helix transcriptional regulator [Deltaproteobacteria bacterium]|nr:helix-turn-helix transcriptional regulator [Deltaproteobacteria bacterium]MBW1955912.1 helix-turn-helix transcriptional regulator [Deltaproteobacteria bacterium]MBW2041316.1 helix-turn-helix transcriptional regulator [Deltaproteobacteria bacterium]MBW2131790.1 helix-turn-helix transcriptional regulator [Deltaproteobacteria bacterium]